MFFHFSITIVEIVMIRMLLLPLCIMMCLFTLNMPSDIYQFLLFSITVMFIIIIIIKAMMYIDIADIVLSIVHLILRALRVHIV